MIPMIGSIKTQPKNRPRSNPMVASTETAARLPHECRAHVGVLRGGGRVRGAAMCTVNEIHFMAVNHFVARIDVVRYFMHMSITIAVLVMPNSVAMFMAVIIAASAEEPAVATFTIRLPAAIRIASSK